MPGDYEVQPACSLSLWEGRLHKTNFFILKSAEDRPTVFFGKELVLNKTFPFKSSVSNRFGSFFLTFNKTSKISKLFKIKVCSW